MEIDGLENNGNDNTEKEIESKEEIEVIGVDEEIKVDKVVR